MRSSIKVSASLLSADFNNLAGDIRALPIGVNYLHIDVMDGSFVPNLSFGYPVIKSLNKITKIPLDIHIMVKHPETYIKQFSRVSPEFLTFHFEATNHPERLAREIRKLGMGAGISLNPATSWEPLKYIYKSLDYILIMTVNPGFSGQFFLYECVEKIREIKKFLKNNGSNAVVSVDGGINSETAPLVIEAGADILVSGSFLFSADNRKNALDMLKKQ